MGVTSLCTNLNEELMLVDSLESSNKEIKLPFKGFNSILSEDASFNASFTLISGNVLLMTAYDYVLSLTSTRLTSWRNASKLINYLANTLALRTLIALPI